MAADRPGLDKDRIVATALELLDRRGFGHLSLKKIADALGVQTPALYWHIKDRAELYGAMVEVMFRESLDAIDPALTGSDFLVAFGRALHATQRRRRDSASLIAYATPTTPLAQSLLQQVMERLVAGNFTPLQAVQAQSVVQAFTLGWSLFEENRAVDAIMEQMMDVPEAFEAGLAAIAAGFRPEGRHAAPGAAG